METINSNVNENRETSEVVDNTVITTEESNILDVSSDIKKISKDDTDLEAVILPSAIYGDLFKAATMIDKLDEEFIKTNYTLEDKKTVGILNDGITVTVKNNSLIKALRDKEAKWEQEPKFADKVLNIRELTVGSNKPGGKITGSAATARFYTELGLGGLIQIPLWHSGFWITLKTIKETDLAALMMSIANNQITLGRETNTLIFSNYSVVMNRLVSEFITRHLQSSTLTLTNSNDILKFIKIQDIQAFALGLIQSIYLKGFKDVRTCVNGVEINTADSKPSCTFKMTSTVDPKKMLWLNRRALTDKHMEHMLKRAPNSMSENEVLEYQSTLKVNKEKVVTINTDNGSLIKVTLETAFLYNHIISGERWVKDVISLTEKLFTEDLDINEKNIRIKSTSKMVLLNVYKHFFKAISLEDGSTVDNEDDISEILEILTSDTTAFKEILKAVKEYIDDNIIAMVAIPNFKCPECQASQNEGLVTNKSFKDLIPVNVMELFFDLSTLKNSVIRERNLD